MQEFITLAISYIRGMWRYRWYAIVVALLIALLGWGWVASKPDTYRSKARIHVDTESVLRPLLSGMAVQPDLDRRLELMTKLLMTSENMEKLARMTDLDLQASNDAEMDALVNRLRSGLNLSGTRRRDFYNISYTSKDPELAQRVVQSFVTMFVESSLGDSRRATDTAQRFIDQQIAAYEQRLQEAENRVLDFKREHMDILKGGDFFSRLQQAKKELEQERLRLREAISRRDAIQQQLEERRQYQDEFALDLNPVGVSTSVDQRLQNVRAQLDELLLRYTEKHPRVKQLQRLIEDLEAQREKELAAIARNKRAEDTSDDQQIEQYTALLADAKATIATIRTRVQEYEARVQKLEEMTNTQPEIETELSRLNRDYEVTKSNYQQLLEKRERLRMGEEVEQAGDNITFKVIESAKVPEAPSGPNRFLLSSGVLALALAAGAGLTFLLSQLRPAVFDRQRLQQITEIPVFGSVSRIRAGRSALLDNLDWILWLALLSGLLVIYAAVIIFEPSGLSGFSALNPIFSIVEKFL